MAAAAADAFHAAHRALYGYDFRGNRASAGRVGEPARHRHRPDPAAGPAALPPGDGDPGRALTGRRPVVFGRAARAADAAIYWRPALAAGDVVPGPAIIEEYGATVPVHPGYRRARRRVRQSPDRVRHDDSRTLTDGGPVDPVLLEIIAGSLAAIEKEVETAIARTSRSPMIRDAHDFRAGIHDRLLRKLTGRSYSALVHPIARDFPLATMRPGDVYFHNDVYLSEGGIGHLPDLCVTVPVLHAAPASGWP